MQKILKDLKNYKLIIICYAVGIVFLSLAYFFGYQGIFNYEFFWLGILVAGVPTILVILNTEDQNKILILLFSFGCFLYLPIIFWSPTYFRFQDEIYHFNLLTLILENGNLNIDPISEVTKYYPGLELLTSFLYKLSGLSLFMSAKLLIGIIHSFILIFLYLLFKVVTSSQKIAALGSFMYTANPSYTFFDAIFAYETLGVLLLIILIFCLYKKEILNTNTFNFILISIIVLMALIITHHFSSYMLFIFLIFLLLINSKLIPKMKHYIIYKPNFIIKFTITTMVLILAWIIYWAIITVKYFGNMISESSSSIISFLIEEAKIQREPFWQSTLPKYELIIDTYLYIPLLFLLYVYCIHIVSKNSKTLSIYTISLISYGFLFFGSLSLIFTSAGQLFMYRIWAFAFIGLSFSAAIALDYLYSKKENRFQSLAFIAIIFILIGGISIGISSPFREPNLKVASVPSSITPDVIYASNWFEEHFDKGNIVLGDLTIYMVFGGYGQQTVRNDPYIFYKEKVDYESVNYLHYVFRHNFIIIDNRISEELSILKYYFSRKEPEGTIWGYKEVLPSNYLNKFDSYNTMYRIYDNKNINIIYIDRQKMFKDEILPK